MIVCHKYRFIFIGLPKVASTSVSIALSAFCGPEDMITVISRPDEQVRQSLGYRGPQNFERRWYQYPLLDLISRPVLIGHHLPKYKHPTAKSARRFVGNDIWNRYYTFTFERNPFDRAISRFHYETRHTPYTDVNEFICVHGATSNWKRYTVRNQVIVDHVGRYEDLDAELVALSARLGLPAITLPRTKTTFRTDRRHYSEILDTRARQRIERACAREIEMFGYHWADAAAFPKLSPLPEPRLSPLNA